MRGLVAACILSAGIFTLSIIDLAPLLTDGQQIVRIRNSLIYKTGGDFDWTPPNSPQWFRHETSAASPFFLSIADKLTRDKNKNNAFELSLEISRHLHPYGRAKGGMIASSTEQTYKQIIDSGQGYCADYTQVFTAIAHALGISVREWGISFDKFSGDGHAFVEVYSERYSKWVFIDVFNGFYVTNPMDIPASYHELKKALLNSESGDVRLKRIEPEIFAFRSDEMALDYISRGLTHSFLWTANDVFTYESNPFIRFTSKISRSLEQASAIIIGVHPEIRIDMNDVDRESVKELARTRLAVFGAAISGCLLFAFAILLLRNWKRRQKSSAH